VWLTPSKSVTVTRQDLTAIRSESLSYSLFLRQPAGVRNKEGGVWAIARFPGCLVGMPVLSTTANRRHAEERMSAPRRGNERLWRRVGNPNAGRGMNRRHAEERMSAPPPGRNSRRTGLAYYQELRPPRAPNVQIPGPSLRTRWKRRAIFLSSFIGSLSGRIATCRGERLRPWAFRARRALTVAI